MTLESWSASSPGVTTTGMNASPVRGWITSRYTARVGSISRNGTPFARSAQRTFAEK
jgi:hypothetical protein